MVFESLVVDLVNRYLGDFIENLDKSQLKIGIWGGDVVLKNLFVKESALDDLDLPIRVLHGNLGSLVLKIPWKNLYTAPVVATLDGLYVVAVPKVSTQYDEEKAQKNAWDQKQKELQRIEDIKKYQAEKDKPSDPKSDSFAEKMATQIIKNLQVEIKNIHVRYEDSFTNPKKPFALGVTLKGLSFQTTDENWKPMIIKETVTQIYKMIQLESLALYWNSRSDSYLKMDRTDVLNVLQTNIIGPGNVTNYKYLLEPISSSAQLRLHTNPELDQFSLPKVLLNVVVEQIGISLNKHQFQDVMEVLESFERMNLATKFHKYHPDVTRKGHAKQWWHFAYNCILNETVRRRRQMWSWKAIKEHRDTCRTYKELYKKKMIKKIGSDKEKILEECEKKLSVFNVTLLRQHAEVENKKEGKKKAEESSGGWFGGWFGGGKKKEEKEEKDIGEQFQELMTNDEKAKLYEAIGYQENAADPTLPIEFIANKISFMLKTLSLTLKDPDQRYREIVKLNLQDVVANLNQRPAASAIKVDAKMDRFEVHGLPGAKGLVPTLAMSQNKLENQVLSLLDFAFETNPMDGECDQRLRLATRPLEIIYDASTINQVAKFFEPPESVHLKQLQAAAFAKLEDLKEQTATGLKHAVETHKYTEINVDVQPSYIILPHSGTYTKFTETKKKKVPTATLR